MATPSTYRPLPAHPPGPTSTTYTPDGKILVTVGNNNTIRVFKTDSDSEPDNIDDSDENNTAVAATNDFFVSGCEDGNVSLYSLRTKTFERYLTRTSLPVRDVALSPDGKWCAVASDELTVRLVGIRQADSAGGVAEIRTLREHNCATKHAAFDPRGGLLALSCTDGVIYIYSLTAAQPELIRKVDGVIGRVEAESDVCSRVAWHPDGRAFAVPTPTRDIQVVSTSDGERQRRFSGHEGDITALAWSPNGAMLASAAKDKKLLIWSTKDQSVVARYEYPGVLAIAWHPTKNLLSFTTADGEVFICRDFVPDQFAAMVRLPRQPAPFIHDPLAEGSANARRPAAGGAGTREANGKPGGGGGGGIPGARRQLDDFDDTLDDAYGSVDDDFVVDDDGAGYTLNAGRKRRADFDDDDDDIFATDRPSKRGNFMTPEYHEAFQPGSTPWRGNRKYLCLNLIGFVWTVDQDSHHTVTVEFYDHEFQRDFHFTDTFLYDKACLTEHGALFSCPPRDEAPATIFYRPHETWTARRDWRTPLPRGEAVLAMSLSDSFVTVTTTAGYVRVYTLFGVPYRVYRPKNAPMVTCASWRDYVLTMGNGPVGADGKTKLVYTIENVKRDEICQNEDTVALPEGASVQSVFFSENGDPCIYDSTGTLLTLLHWRRPSRASWIPLLDTKLLSRLASGRKHEAYYPIAVADNKFHCIILKGGDKHPYFPRPLLSEFEFSVPLTSAPPPAKDKKRKGGKKKTGGDLDGDEEMADDLNDLADNAEDDDHDDDDEEEGDAPDALDAVGEESRRLEQVFLLRGLQAAQMADLVDDENDNDSEVRGKNSSSGAGRRPALARLELEVDKALLQLLAVECREGEDRGMRALELVQLMRDRTGRMAEAAGKVAERYGRGVLGDKIRELGERRLGGGDGRDGMEDDDLQ